MKKVFMGSKRMQKRDERTGLFIGRFQPFHIGHLQDIRLILRQTRHIIIAVGSAQEQAERDNCFSYQERRRMLLRSLTSAGIDMQRVRITPLQDTGKDVQWYRNAIRAAKTPEDSLFIYSANPKVIRIFRSHGHKVRILHIRHGISSTRIRAMIRRNDEAWRKLVPSEVACIIGTPRMVRRICRLSTTKTKTIHHPAKIKRGNSHE